MEARENIVHGGHEKEPLEWEKEPLVQATKYEIRVEVRNPTG